MNAKLVAGGVIVVAGAVAAVLLLRGRGGNHHHPHHDTATIHAGGIDEADTSVSIEAMMKAPEGATPCETAYAAIEAEQAAAKLRGTRSIFQFVAPKPDFLAGCAALPETVQKCMAPRYRREHDDECLRARPDSEALKKLVVGITAPEPTMPQ
jgi:hypothetical protein